MLSIVYFILNMHKSKQVKLKKIFKMQHQNMYL